MSCGQTDLMPSHGVGYFRDGKKNAGWHRSLFATPWAMLNWLPIFSSALYLMIFSTSTVSNVGLFLKKGRAVEVRAWVDPEEDAAVAVSHVRTVLAKARVQSHLVLGDDLANAHIS
ncbi:hypothetical protein M569_17420 [Genlisea aurea]|uniref:Uncharacterized protein n=1 Tax=Genlisea aurea TaxID=192259 RepID=S8BSQ2_9LAMI|nr:hypothetical protein M569_17420 [Genlisea aurea]